jgi:outer membrane receptor for ferrienterochelin and colicins
MWLAICLVMSTLVAAPAAAQSSSSLMGVVRDPSGAVVARATVIIAPADSSFSRIVESGRDGVFTFRTPDGDYRVTVVSAGFEAATTTTRVPAMSPLEVTLRPAPVVEQVRVTSAARQEELRQHLNTRVDVVSRARLEDTGAQSVGEVLRELPGVLTRRGSETAGQAGEQIQGIDSRQVLVLLDGQPIPSARGIKRGIVNLDRQSTARLDRVEVVKGASSALYGSDAIGGVINLITRDAGAPIDLNAGISGGSLGVLQASVEAGVRRGGWSALFVGERHQHDGFDLTPATFDTTGAPYRRVDGLLKVAARLHPALTVSALATGYRNSTAGRSVGELGPQEDDIDDRTMGVNLVADWLVRPTTTVQARLYTSRFDERATARLVPPVSQQLEPGSLDEDITKADVSLSAVLGSRQHVLAGVEYWDHRYAGTNRIAFDEVTARTTVGWAQHRATLGRVTTTVGARVDHHSAFGTAVSPKAAANVRLTDQLHARASYGGGFRAPDLGQLYYRFLNPSAIYQVIGNSRLEPEFARSLQIGADYQLASGRARFGVNVFRNDVDDLIESLSLGFVATPAQLASILEREGLDSAFRPVLGRLLFTYKNVNDAYTQGAEFDGEVALTSEVSVAGAYTYLQARDAQQELDLTGRHAHQGHVRITWHSNRIGLRANLRATAYSSWIAARAGTVDTVAPGFMLWDAYASQRLVGGLSGFAAIDNLTNNQDLNTGILTEAGTPAPIYRLEAGRTVRFGLRWAWSK